MSKNDVVLYENSRKPLLFEDEPGLQWFDKVDTSSEWGQVFTSVYIFDTISKQFYISYFYYLSLTSFPDPLVIFYIGIHFIREINSTGNFISDKILYSYKHTSIKSITLHSYLEFRNIPIYIVFPSSLSKLLYKETELLVSLRS